MTDSDSFLSNLQLQIVSAFNMEELQLLTTAVSVDWDELAGETKSAKTGSLLRLLHRRQRLPDLITALRRRSSSTQWPDCPPNLKLDGDQAGWVRPADSSAKNEIVVKGKLNITGSIVQAGKQNRIDVAETGEGAAGSIEQKGSDS